MFQFPGPGVGGDIKIESAVLRYGEKLYQTVLANKEITFPTHHERIIVSEARENPYLDASNAMKRFIGSSSLVTIPDMVRLMRIDGPRFHEHEFGI